MEDSGRNQYTPDAYFCLHLSSEMYVGTSSGKKMASRRCHTAVLTGERKHTLSSASTRKSKYK